MDSDELVPRNQKALGYEVLNDTSCGMKLVLISDSTILLFRNFPSNGNHKTNVISLGFALCFSNIQPSEAMDLSVPPTQIIRVQSSYEDRFELRTLKIIARTNNHIASESQKEILFLIHLTD